jgi:hypothetical protein
MIESLKSVRKFSVSLENFKFLDDNEKRAVLAFCIILKTINAASLKTLHATTRL